ncbi:putative late blight resistance protein homolog R1B-16 [Sesamum indicum]|uniref:Late blight resistance protein homolog R1B-16 n=1 Tax=Sesamum indicum TaxID=4182 RepID=A0A6I9U0V1_SESIN|nr:putative late blight resistance protein homolog R1B-16 [Sesamum indicum]XP_020553172.1 putative late blight resistance protein homolog R1B-16 [Sesamum indicum]XP_020553173.1 putative late blight resistance protein homolog R1B-16 [Sesamum indicum]XP_020553174.1 putative late blight resistance protein homolog R1B-16 [Sesamum indicum]XP_020553175.1 putative late blight resistance protein homolog R1B-16 [Sesamum indicum]
MAYNLESLTRILEQILHPNQQRWILDHNKKPQMESLLKKASSLKQIPHNSSSASGPSSTASLMSQIRDAAHKAEDITESHMVDRRLSKPGAQSCIISPPDVHDIVQELDSAMDKLLRIVKHGSDAMRNSSFPDVVSSTPDSTSNNIVVGLDEDLIQLKDRLTGLESELQIIPIVGMGGIGKTTLARNLYNDPLVVSHFDTRAWIVISQDYDVRAILLGLLGCIVGKLTDEVLQKNNSQLAVALYKNLTGRRYLVVLDDIWSTDAWDNIKMFFPGNNNRSRIVLTTRESNVANYVDLSSSYHQMHLLTNSESWNLLHQKVFGEDNCPPEFEKIGRSIASYCGGLPLAIHVIGGLLSEAKGRRDVWEHVADDVRAAIAGKDEQFYNVLALSYNHLPYHLKPCFLYMGAFPEDHEIRASKLIRIWVAEGFLKSNGDKSLEEIAEENLRVLADRNLLMVREWKSNGKAKTYGIHDLLRDLCVKKAAEDKFLHVKNRQVHNVPEGSSYFPRRVSVHQSYRIRDVYNSTEFMSLARSFLCIGLASRVILSPVFFALRLLRVLEVLDIEFHQFPTEILELVNLRYLAFYCNSEIPSAISRLWNLQTLIVGSILRSFELPSEIWEMPELRHIKFRNSRISIYSVYQIPFVHEKLQTISAMSANVLIDSNILGSVPNIKNLGIYSWIPPRTVVDLSLLPKLETLKFSDFCLIDHGHLSEVIFPPSVIKLALRSCTITWEFIKSIGSLPNLQVLKMRICDFKTKEMQSSDEEWEPTEGEFSSLQFLLLEKLKLVRWKADKTHFPRLRHLVIRECSALEEIPRAIGDIPTLEIIELDECSPSVVASARQIQEDQSENGNDGLEVRIC